MERYTNFFAPIKCSSLSPDTKILCPMISFIVKTTWSDNQYSLTSRTCTDGSYILEGVEFKVSYAPVSSMKYLQTIISISSTDGMIFLILDISNVFQNNILTNLEGKAYPILPHLCLEWFKRKWTKYPLAPHNPKEPFIVDQINPRYKNQQENFGMNYLNLYSTHYKL